MDLLSSQAIYRQLEPFCGSGRWLVAYSGGLDSTVLLHCLCGLRQQYSLPELCALHVNHQLSAAADEWQRHCESTCRSLGVEFITERVVVPKDGAGPEAAARNARYGLFERYLGAGECLLQAHHLDDQVETFLLRLLRGAGLAGLAAMPSQRPLGQGTLLRPLLSWTRQQLADHAVGQGLSWVEDDSNQDLALDRNYLRKQILTRLERRWPAYRNSIGTAIEAARESDAAVLEYFAPKLDELMGCAHGEFTLSLSSWGKLEELARRQLLRAWLRRLNCRMPERKALVEFVRQVGDADAPGRAELRSADYCLRRYRNRLFLALAKTGEPPRPHFKTTPGRGISVARGGQLRVAVRKGGERCRPAGRQHSQTLKKLLREYQVPPWQRKNLPLVFNERDQLVAVADLWVCEGFQATAGEPGLELGWHGQEG
ncbi:MAG: tRNA lysidine(34) synthetase TilS [Halieaceae bacterium]|nr:tRNA lysidine(34) synthetase TilS [Halieaceae bacterium]